MTKLFEGTPGQALAPNDPRSKEMQTSFVAGLIAGVRESRASTPIAGGKPFLRLAKTGQLVFGASNEPVQQGSEWAVNPYSIGHGWVCWATAPGAAQKLLGEAMAPITSRKPVMPEAIPGGEWKEQRSFDLKCLNGDDEGTEVQYKVNSKGGMRAVDNLFGKLVDHWEKDQTNVVAILQLSSDYYMHNDYGQMFFPVFTISGWADIDGNRLEEGEDDLADDGAVGDVIDVKPAATVKAPLQPAERPGAAPRRQRPGGRV